jgi:muramoyltetrapeptide carboxypeptidase
MSAALTSLILNPLPKGFSKDMEFLKPQALKLGDTVGFITPSTPIFDHDLLSVIKSALKHLGLQLKIGKNVGKRLATYADTVKGRLDDFHAMFADTEVKAVITEGGYGCTQLLDQIDYDLIRQNPKIFLGFSDTTALHLAIHKMTNLVTIHGGILWWDLNNYGMSEFTIEHLRPVIFNTKPAGVVTNPQIKNQIRSQPILRTVHPGKATAPLVGGNLSLIAATMGTPYEIETDGKILFLEDVREAPYGVDRMLTQLRLAGKFKKVKGVIWGECESCGPRFGAERGYRYSLSEVIENLLKPLGLPVLSGMTIGHTTDMLTLPLGVRATLDADQGTLNILESSVI